MFIHMIHDSFSALATPFPRTAMAKGNGNGNLLMVKIHLSTFFQLQNLLMKKQKVLSMKKLSVLSKEQP